MSFFSRISTDFVLLFCPSLLRLKLPESYVINVNLVIQIRKLTLVKYLAQYFIYFSQLTENKSRVWSLALGGGIWNREGISICVEFL